MDLVVLSDRAATATQLGESHFREFKSALEGAPPTKKNRELKLVCADIAETLVAFANADGGELLVGVEDNGETTGVESFTPAQLEAMENAPKARVHAETPLTSVRVARVSLKGHTVLYFSVKKGTEYVHLTSDGRCLQRRDLASVPIPAERIQFDRQESLSRAYDRDFVDGPQADALNLAFVRAVAEQVSPGMSPEKCLQYLDLAEYAGGLRLRKAALLLFGKDAERWHPRLQLRILKVNGTEVKTGTDYNVTADELVHGNIIELVEKGWDALRPHLVQTTLQSSAKFETRVMYPEYACREALVNAIAHRDYAQEGRGIEIFIFSDRMEVVNPGALLSTLTVEDLRRLEGVHQSRNSLIARVLRELGYMRELGEGLRRIFQLMTMNELAPPDIKSSRESFTITLHHKALYSEKELFWLEQFTELNLSREQKAVVILGRDGNIFSPQDIWNRLGIVDTEHYRQIVDSLQKVGILVSELTRAQVGNLAKKMPRREVPRYKIVPLSELAARGRARDRVERAEMESAAPKGRLARTDLRSGTDRRRVGNPDVDAPDSSSRVYVGNLNLSVTRQQLHELFSKHGEILEIDLPLSGQTNRGYAIIEFRTVTLAVSAMKALHDNMLAGKPLKLRPVPRGLRG